MAVVTGTALLLKGTNGLSILLGSGPPDNSLGVDGQPGYLDTTNNLLYGPKVSGAWPTTGTQFGGNFILKSGAPASTDGMVGNLSLDVTAGFIYGPKTSTGWPSQPLLSLVGPRGPIGPQGASYTLPADLTANSLILAPVAGDSNAVQLAIKNSSGAILWGVDTNGNEVVGGNFNVTGNATINGTTKVTTLAFGDGTTMKTAASGTGSSSSGGSGGPILDTFFMGTFNNAGTNFPTSYTSADAYFVNAQYSAQNAASRSGCAYTATYAATVYSIQGYNVGNTSGATVNVGLYKNGTFTGLQTSYSGSGGGFYAQTSSGSPISVTVGDVFQFFVKSTSSTTNTPLVGWMSLQQSGSASAVFPREPIDMGVYQYGTNSAGGYSATKKPSVTAGSTTIGSNADFTWIAPWPGSIVGYSFQQNSSAAATNNIIYRKNGTNNTAISIGSGAGNFAGTHPVGTYTFAAGDKIQLLNGTSNGGNTDVSAIMYVQWSA